MSSDCYYSPQKCWEYYDRLIRVWMKPIQRMFLKVCRKWCTTCWPVPSPNQVWPPLLRMDRLPTLQCLVPWARGSGRRSGYRGWFASCAFQIDGLVSYCWWRRALYWKGRPWHWVDRLTKGLDLGGYSTGLIIIRRVWCVAVIALVCFDEERPMVKRPHAKEQRGNETQIIILWWLSSRARAQILFSGLSSLRDLRHCQKVVFGILWYILFT